MTLHVDEQHAVPSKEDGIWKVDRSVDVVIVGAGPAGTATALELRRAGYTVTLVERGRYESIRIGETLPPDIKQPLFELGVWDDFLADQHLPSPGIVSAWGGSALYQNDFIVNPYGPGWHVDRRRFDATLARVAEERGAELMLGAKLWACTRSPSGTWLVEAMVDGRKVTRHATILVDATGRAATVARRFGGKRRVYDQLIGIVKLFSAATGEADLDRRTLIEAVENGWWYCAPIPGGQQIVAFMTDANLLPKFHGATESFWQSNLKMTSHVSRRLAPFEAHSNLGVVSASSSRLEEARGTGWLAVGDAAAAFDPLSSQGLIWALKTGQMAAEACRSLLLGDEFACKNFAWSIQAEFGDYLRTRTRYYQAEGRWRNATFWMQRQSMANVEPKEAVAPTNR